MADFNIRSDSVTVEQIMEQIRARIREKRGVDYTEQQIRDLAAVKLEKFLDPRGVRSDLLEQFRKAQPAYTPPELPNYAFEDQTLYESTRPPLRWVRKLLNPILKLFFNPNPLIRALNIQSRLNVEAAQREAERVQQQAEWNALHYEILQRLVTEVSRVSLEVQATSLQIESLGAKVDFNERRVRGIEGSLHQGGRAPAPREAPAPVQSIPAETVADTTHAEPAAPGEAPSGESHQRRRRRRRRGRRGAGAPEMAAVSSTAAAAGEPAEPEDIDEGGDEDAAEAPPTVTTEGEPVVSHSAMTFPSRPEPPAAPASESEPEPARADAFVTPPAAEPRPDPGPDDQ